MTVSQQHKTALIMTWFWCWLTLKTGTGTGPEHCSQVWLLQVKKPVKQRASNYRDKSVSLTKSLAAQKQASEHQLVQLASKAEEAAENLKTDDSALAYYLIWIMIMSTLVNSRICCTA